MEFVVWHSEDRFNFGFSYCQDTGDLIGTHHDDLKKNEAILAEIERRNMSGNLFFFFFQTQR